MDFLYGLEESPIGMLISSTLWGYPIALSLHALGMAVLVGISAMLALRVLGFVEDIPKSAILPYWRLAQAGFVVNLLSGSTLFLGSASSLASNWAFLTKLCFLALSLFLTFRMMRVAYQDEVTVGADNRLLASAALASWVATIVFGRIIGYIF